MKRTLYVVTLEPIEQRYTKQWYKHWKKEFGKFFNVKYIDGPGCINDKIDKGRFLDINKTNHWKAEQVIDMSELIGYGNVKDDDIFIFMDGWHFGITALKYMLQLNKIDAKIFTYLHAGTWDKHDFITQAGLGDWASHNELGWLLACDGHFVATNFHKELITKYFGKSIIKNIHVVGFPMDWERMIEDEKIKYNVKKNVVVFPHRLDPEKQPEKFDVLSKRFPKYKFIKTLEVTENKKQYYEVLQGSRVCFSASLQETYGIGTVEGLMLGVIPLVPNRLSYTELYDDMFLYNNTRSAESKIKYFMKNSGKHEIIGKALKENKEKIIAQSLNSVKLMAKEMLKC
jgi:glycosyltransferase involved in cell wall biosynthesis